MPYVFKVGNLPEQLIGTRVVMYGPLGRAVVGQKPDFTGAVVFAPGIAVVADILSE
jgi:hypothetical protein